MQVVKPQNEWGILPPGEYKVEGWILFTDRDYGKRILSGAMGVTKERDELVAIVREIPDQLAEIRKDLRRDIKEVELAMNERIEVAVRQSYWKGFREGALVGVAGLGLFSLLW